MESVGEKLKRLRLEKGLSLEEVHKKTKIHLNILKGIEEDSLINFNPVYIKGFLKIYCKFLGIDPRDYLSNYKEPINYISGKKGEVFSKPPYLKVHHLKIKKILIIAIIAISIIGIYNLGKFISSQRKAILAQKDRLLLPIVAKAKTKEKNQLPKTQKTPQALTIRLGIHAKENCYVTLKTDGRVVFRGILRKGLSEAWQAKERMELSLGNAGVVDLEINGKIISSLGRKGQAIKNILITKEGLSIPR
jgi:transcriptional regulator with XRE-family HTH domain